MREMVVKKKQQKNRTRMWLNVFYVDPLIVMFVKPTLQNLANHWPNNNYNYIVTLYPRNVLATEDLLTLIRVLSSFSLSLF